MPREVFVAGQILTAAELNTVSDQSVMVFAGTAARGSAIPTPSEGMVTYREDDNVVEVYDGSVFKAVGPGKILQVVSTTKTDTFTSTSTSHTDVTGLSVSITPSSASSKIMVFSSVNMSATGQDRFYSLQLLRDSTAIAVGAASGSKTQAFSGSWTENNVLKTSETMLNFAPMTLDSPATTSAVTYKIQVRINNATDSVVVNRTGIDGDDARYVRGASTITAMEVAG